MHLLPPPGEPHPARTEIATEAVSTLLTDATDTTTAPARGPGWVWADHPARRHVKVWIDAAEDHDCSRWPEPEGPSSGVDRPRRNRAHGARGHRVSRCAARRQEPDRGTTVPRPSPFLPGCRGGTTPPDRRITVRVALRHDSRLCRPVDSEMRMGAAPLVRGCDPPSTDAMLLSWPGLVGSGGRCRLRVCGRAA